jgi:hypothetical protein
VAAVAVVTTLPGVGEAVVGNGAGRWPRATSIGTDPTARAGRGVGTAVGAGVGGSTGSESIDPSFGTTGAGSGSSEAGPMRQARGISIAGALLFERRLPGSGRPVRATKSSKRKI